MRIRLLLIALLLSLVFGAPERSADPGRSYPLWACSDGKGTISLFWLPSEGRWPVRGFQLERIVRGKKTVLARDLGPARDEAAMAALEPGDAAEIRALAAGILAGSLTEEDRRRSIAVNGRSAAVDIPYGRALGVRYADSGGGAGKRVYRLIAPAGDGTLGDMLVSGEVDPARRTPGPGRPPELKAQASAHGVALSWPDPPADAVSPVVAYHVDRARASGKAVPLTRKPLVLARHLKKDAPEYLDPEPPRGILLYSVRSLDIFGRRSAPVRVKVAASAFASLQAGRPPAAAESGPVTEETLHAAPAAAGQATAPVPAAESAPGPAPAPPEPSIATIQGTNGKVTITFHPGLRPDGGLRLMVFRSESPTGTGVPVGRPFPADTGRWEDNTVEAGQSFWYRVVPVDGDGKPGASSKPRWVRVSGVDGTSGRAGR